MSVAVQTPGGAQPASRRLAWHDQVSGTTIFLWMLVSAVAAVAVILGLISAWSGQVVADVWHHRLLLCSWGLMLGAPGPTLAALLAQHRLWQARIAPRSVLRGLHHAWRRAMLTTACLALAGPWALACVVPPSTGTLPSLVFSAAWLLATLALGTLASAAWRGLVSGWWLLPAVVAGLGFVAIQGTDAETARWLPAQGWRAAMLACLLLTPLLAWRLLRQPLGLDAQHLPAGTCGPLRRSPADWWHTHRLAWAERMRTLDGPGASGILAISWGHLLSQQVMSQREEGFIMPWGSAMTMSGLYRWLLLALIAMMALRGPMLHWRQLLAPGAGQRHTIGLQVIASTWVLLAAMFALLFGGVGTISLLLTEARSAWLATLATALWRYGPLLLLDLALATALAAMLRAWAGSLGRALWWLLALAAVCGGVHLGVYHGTGQANAVLLRRDGSYVALAALLTAVLAWAAQQAWKRVDLGDVARQRRLSDPDH